MSFVLFQYAIPLTHKREYCRNVDWFAASSLWELKNSQFWVKCCLRSECLDQNLSELASSFPSICSLISWHYGVLKYGSFIRSELFNVQQK